MQLRTAIVFIVVVVALVAWLVLAPSGTPGGSSPAGAAEVAVAAFAADADRWGQHQRTRA